MSIQGLSLSTVLKKTTIGMQEMGSRTLGLQQRKRSLLILVDGKVPIAKLLSVLPDQELAKQLLADLLAQGLIEVSSSPKDVTPAIDTNPRLTPAKFEQLKKNASHWLEDILGVDAQRLCLLLEQCKTKEDFDVRFEKTVNIVAQMTNPAKAAAYQERVLNS